MIFMIVLLEQIIFVLVVIQNLFFDIIFHSAYFVLSCRLCYPFALASRIHANAPEQIGRKVTQKKSNIQIFAEKK